MGAEQRPGQVSRLGQPNFQQFKDGLPGGGGSGQQLNRGVIPSSLDPFEARLHGLLEQQRAYSESKGWYFHPSEYLFSYLLRERGIFQGEVPKGVDVEEAHALGQKMALALGILAYPEWRPQDQSDFREILQTDGFIQYCEEAQLQGKREAFIDWDREWEHDHYIKLPEAGRQLLKRITNVVGVPYDPQQDTFFFSTVLNQPEPIVPEE